MKGGSEFELPKLPSRNFWTGPVGLNFVFEILSYDFRKVITASIVVFV